MIQDLHSHTYYSFCGKDAPQAVVEAAIEGGIELLGITDHNYGIGYGRWNAFALGGEQTPCDYENMLFKYFDHIAAVSRLYSDRIRVLAGIEIATVMTVDRGGYGLPEDADVSFFDYCLIENLDAKSSCTGGDIFAYGKRCGTKWVGIAHTDLFAHIERLGADPKEYFKRMAAENIFWEMNVNYDKIHSYREHKYVSDFFSDPAKQEIVRESGVRVSVGFDGHRVEDYLPFRVAEYNQAISKLGIKKPFEE